MSLDTSTKVFAAIIFIGLIIAVYFLVKDRIEIIRSIKPNSIGEFFGLNDFGPHTSPLRYMLSRTLVNLLTLLIWVPFWVLDKLFKLNIFKENNSK